MKNDRKGSRLIINRLIACSIALMAAAGAMSVGPAQAAEKIITIGTAGVTGVYYPAGGAICRLVNRGRKEHGIRCTVESTGGSISNLEAIHNGDIELGVVQSDMLYEAYNGKGVFSDAGSDKKLRAVFALHSEPFTLVARKSAKIIGFDDLKGKRVYIGSQGSGPRATMEELMQRKGWSHKTVTMVDIKPGEMAQALCSGKIDAMVYAGGHPNGAIQQIAGQCPIRLVNVTGPVIDRLIAEQPFYSYATLPGGMYAGNPQEVKTFGVRAELAASANLDDETVYQIVKAVFDNLDNFKTLHPVFATLDARGMVRDSAIIPLHPGALRYFREKGLVD